jgi:hypothetical protein
VSVNSGGSTPGLREDSTPLGWCYREGPRRGEQIERALAPKAGGSSAPMATVNRSFRRPCDAFEHPHALGG